MKNCSSGPGFYCELYLLFDSLFFALAPFTVLVALSALIAFAFLLGCLFVQRLQRPQIAYLFVIFFSLALVGTVSGFSAGMSRTAAVGAVVPAVLSLIGGVVIYLFGASNSKNLLPAIGTTVLVLGLSLGLSTGSNMRGRISPPTDKPQNAQSAAVAPSVVCKAIILDVAKELASASTQEAQDVKQVAIKAIASRCNRPFKAPKE